MKHLLKANKMNNLNENQKELILQYLKEILEVNISINLTRITDPQDAEILHIEDSLSIIQEMNEAPEGLYGDLGTGGGFPGVPLAIATKRETILVDSIKKKITAIESVLSNLNIQDIGVYSGRIEELALEMPEEFSVLTARALSSLNSLLELSAPLLKINGWLICLKSHISMEELDNALAIEDKVGMKLIKRRDFYLSDNETYREIFVFEKVSEPKVKLPRRIGLAQKKPLTK